MGRSPLDHDEWKEHLETLPPVRRDVSFWGMTLTQFLGAFNDNLFKQLVLLVCTDLYLRSSGTGAGDGYQAVAFAVFTLPFVMFSGLAGYLSDLFEKRTIVILSKVAEIVVMGAGAVAFYFESITGLFVVLFFMGAQSAFFGPSKYGLLPEAYRARDLPFANGVFIMTTFLAIIFGTVLAGELKDEAHGVPVWMASMACVVTAVIGTVTALVVRRTPAANPGLRFQWSNLAIDGQTWRLIREDRLIFDVLMITSVFWCIGGVIQQAVNGFAKYQLAISDHRTGRMLAGVAIGIAVGCLIAGRVSKGKINFRVYKAGNLGIIVTLLALGMLGVFGPDRQRREPAPPAAEVAAADETIATIETVPAAAPAEATQPEEAPMTAIEWAYRILLILTGVSAGLFTVPLQTFLQVRPPDQEKGRVIAAMNLFNWIGILLAAAMYFLVSFAIDILHLPQAVHFLACAIVMTFLFLFRIDSSRSPTVHGD